MGASGLRHQAAPACALVWKGKWSVFSRSLMSSLAVEAGPGGI